MSKYLEKYSKQPLTISQQIHLLKERHLAISDDAFAARILMSVGYYRLSAYLYPFRGKDGSNDFVLGTSIEKVWNYYRFDRKLRFLIIDALERIEVAIKGFIANNFTLSYGPFGYNNTNNFASPIDTKRHDKMLEFIRNATSGSTEEFVRHFKDNYDTSMGLPLWMATEVMTFGNMLTFFRLMKKQDKRAIAKEFAISEEVLESWLISLNYVRNICAHHGRIWNRVLAIRPTLPRKLANWHEEKFPIETSRIYSILTILRFLLQTIAPQSHWSERVLTLLTEFKEIPHISMGIPVDFVNSALWKGK